MKRLFVILLLTTALFCTPLLSAQDAPQPVPVENNGFETGGDMPEGWTFEPVAGAAVSRDTQVALSGAASLRIEAGDTPASVTVSSSAMTLEVGHLYRLSGYIRTQGVHSDPTARYPVAVPACISMYSFPFTEHSSAAGADSDWTKVSISFLAASSTDRVQLHLGRNGAAGGTVWFDDISLEKVDDIGEIVPLESLRWFGPAYRYDEKGWIIVHIEGEPYERGYQYGYLLAEEITQYMDKLAHQQNFSNPAKGWDDMRFMSDAMLLRKYDEEYLIEMRGIADGTNHAGITYRGRELDLVDIVAINSAIDLGQMDRALGATPHPLTGRNFLREEQEMLLEDDYNKCSSFVATGDATVDGRIVFGQIFMWGGYTGVHWDVICDLQPTEGHRLVYHTFPGGIHSGADFYINEAGIIIGETTVSQTPYEAAGTPQSNRIRKAAQYASTFEEVQQMLFEGNNGMYTNDWTLANAKTDEGGCLLLGTNKYKLWRTGNEKAPKDTPADHEGFIWANNNNRDPDVRGEYIAHPENAPYDLIFRPANRDIAFQEFFDTYGDGKIDHIAAVNLWASSPINRAHACDGKITTGEMAERLVFLAHYGKTTLREKMVGERFIPDWPGAKPHLSLGYTTISPIYVTDRLHELRREQGGEKEADIPTPGDAFVFNTEETSFTWNDQRMWQNTVFPANNGANWFVSATSAYWHLLRDLPEDSRAAMKQLQSELNELTVRYQYLVSREGDLPALEARRVYDAYNHYYMPRIKGTFALHQLRLHLGNERFAAMMQAVHDTYAGRQMSTRQFIETASGAAGEDLTPLVMQWLEREGLPNIEADIRIVRAPVGHWEVMLTIDQRGPDLYDYYLHVGIETEAGLRMHKVRINRETSRVSIDTDYRPLRVLVNAGGDAPLPKENFYTMGNFIDDFHHTTMVSGTSQQVEANNTIALNWSHTLADAYVEILVPIRKDCELTEEERNSRDLMVMGGPFDNSFTSLLIREGHLPELEFGRHAFKWQGRWYTEPDDAIVLVKPNPWNPDRVLYLFVANSALQLHTMTERYQRGMATWTLFNGGHIVATGYDPVSRYNFDVAEQTGAMQ